MIASRTIQSDERIPSLDGLRALAILIVMVSHLLRMPALGQFRYLPWLNRAISGAYGVQLFFVISGFIITLLLVREERGAGRANLMEFYQRRVVRIVPPMAAFLAVVATLDAAGWIGDNARGIAASVLFIRNYVVDHQWQTGHLWSLSVEEQFYIAWPFVLVFLPTIRNAVLWVAVVFGPMVRWWAIGKSFPGQDVWLITNLDCFAVGCLIALERNRWQRYERDLSDGERKILRGLALLSFVLVRALPGWLNPYIGWLPETAIALASGYLIVSLTTVRRGLLFDLANSPTAAAVGIISYDLYLWQQLFLSPQPLLTSNPIVAVLLALSAGWLAWFCISRPLAKLRKKLHRPDRSMNSARASSSPTDPLMPKRRAP